MTHPTLFDIPEPPVDLEPVTDYDRRWLALDPKRRLVRHRDTGHLGHLYPGNDIPVGFDVVSRGAL